MYFVPIASRPSALARTLERLFDDTLDRTSQAGGETRTPALDVDESDHAYTVRLDLPGVNKEDVKISIDGQRVDVQAEARQDSDKRDGERVVHRERSVARFARSFTLPVELDESASSAKLDSGVLTLTLGKREAAKPTRIAVN